jgi:hypothetical protein
MGHIQSMAIATATNEVYIVSHEVVPSTKASLVKGHSVKFVSILCRLKLRPDSLYVRAKPDPTAGLGLSEGVRRHCESPEATSYPLGVPVPLFESLASAAA